MPILWIMIGVSQANSFSKKVLGEYIYKFKPRYYVKITVFFVAIMYVLTGTLELISMNMSIWLIITYVGIMAIIIILASLFIKPEGITERGILFKSVFIKYEDISIFEWKPHFTKKNIYLSFKLRTGNKTLSDRFFAVPIDDKEEIEKVLNEQLDKREREITLETT